MNNSKAHDEIQNTESQAESLLSFERCLRTNPDIADLQARYPQIDDEFIRHVEEFVEQYRPALERLAQR